MTKLCKDCFHLYRYEQAHQSLPSSEVFYHCLCPALTRTNPVTGGELPADPFMENEDCDCAHWKKR